MLGSFLVGSDSSSPSKNRVFVYEVSGLKQNEENDRHNYPLRRSGNVFLRVPYNRMNEEMLRISKMGGKIVNIQTLESFQNQNEVASKTENSSERSDEE